MGVLCRNILCDEYRNWGVWAISIPLITLDAPFLQIFMQEKSLKQFLNSVYGYDDRCYINKIEYLNDKIGTLQNSGFLIPDIRCRCTLNKQDENGDIEFILEMQRCRQSSYVDRGLLKSARVMGDGFVSSINEAKRCSCLQPQQKRQPSALGPRKSSSVSHEEKFRLHVRTVRHLSILRDSFNGDLGWMYHIAPIVVRGKLKDGKLNRSTMEPVLEMKDSLATDKQLYTFIQLKGYVKQREKGEVATGTTDDWLDILALDLMEEARVMPNGPKLYMVPEIDNEDVNGLVEFC